jgi:hypothetical protein
MDIVMLGHSGAGKTTYMALMYEQLNRGLAGFRVSAERNADHQRLLRQAGDIRRRRYPPPSDQRAVYDLLLRHEGSDVVEFRWRDYRGGALTERTASGQTTELIEDLASADGIVAFLDAKELYAGSRAALRQARSISVLLTTALEKRKAITPLVLALTKADLLPAGADLTQPLTTAFGSLVSAVMAARHVAGTALTVACGPEPHSVEIPVLWCLHYGILARANAHASKVEAAAQAADMADRYDTVGDRLVSWWRGEPSWRDIGVRNRLAAQEEARKLQPLVAPARGLEDLLQDQLIF